MTPPAEGTDRLAVSGRLEEADLVRLFKNRREARIGPTVIYYAGVTAPIISAGMAIYGEAALSGAGLNPIIAVLLSSCLAALAGIVWYVIFMRLSERRHFGRSAETDLMTEILSTDDGLSVSRGDVQIRVGWPAITGLKRAGKAMLVSVHGGQDVIIPDRWFANTAERKAFAEEVARQVAPS